ncbi:hypothetical protein DESUT3_01190 [Desulfuromonas versatilis]|uniref:Lipoprotein n=1 Tax=Desulfuromonas versatilis TaxID=2802975 RepID=A0ABM8HRG4_9BACT|nr:YgdI/YgdR family lipoprotein [Desulfuromonas versatilis]BCR03050.1 hypothetical protein DESUT3_01190 [Desulfuromonas versatilis]
MKKLITLVLVSMLALSLSACATTKGGDKARVKCPACGYEFEVPATPGN